MNKYSKSNIFYKIIKGELQIQNQDSAGQLSWQTVFPQSPNRFRDRTAPTAAEKSHHCELHSLPRRGPPGYHHEQVAR